MLRAAALGFVLAACNSQPAQPRELDVELDPPEPALASSSTAKEIVPPAPITAAELVAEGRSWRLATPHGAVHVWTPQLYNARRADTIIYVHGYYTHVDQAWTEHNLPFQFAAADIDAMFIACDAPAGPDEPVAWPDLTALLETVARGIDQPMPKRRIVAVGHSGAYRTLLGWLANTDLDTVVLVDAAYGEIESYKQWVLAAPKHRLVDIGDDTRKWTDELHAQLPTTVTLDGFPSVEDEIPRTAARAKILYIRSDLGHFPLVTGGIALPMVLRTLRMRHLLDVPLAELVQR